MAKRKKQSFRDASTDDAIIRWLAEHKGDMPRRDIVRKFGQRRDLTAALHRLTRKGVIESVEVRQVGKRATARVRLIGLVAVASGAGYMRVGGVR